MTLGKCGDMVLIFVLGGCGLQNRSTAAPSSRGTAQDTAAKQGQIAQGEYNAVDTRMRSSFRNCLNTWKFLVPMSSARAIHSDLIAGARVSSDGSVGEVTLALGDGSPISGNLKTCVSMALHKEHFEQPENRNRTLSFKYRMW